MAEVDDASPSEGELARNNRAAAGGGVEAQPRDVRQSAAQAYKSYRRWLRLKRLALAAFVTVATLFLLWAIPWLPSGLDTDDYTPELAFTTYLLLGVVLTGAGAMTCQELARRRREGMLAWTSVYDEATGLRNRAYLYDRLSLECDRAEHDASVFSVLVLRVSGSAPILERLAELIERVIHRSDIVALLSGRELAILSVGLGEKERGLLLERLRGAVAAELCRLPGKPAIKDIQGGAATYGVDGDDPNTLVQAARSRVMRELASSTQAA
ncbi:MAG: hypothetical protein IIB22_03620 [Chloroflexi bacterium]|nr:hypothetical protein [Chloroflexota bacterium]